MKAPTAEGSALHPEAGPGPLVSVVLPVRDRAGLVEAAARCVLDQTIADLELIVVDGASTDGTVAVLQRLEAADPRVRLVLQPQANGVSAARNAGARMARGRWLAFQDSDDAWRADKLERQLDALAAMPDARLAYCGVRRRLPHGLDLRPARWDSARPVEGDMHQAFLRESLVTTPALVVDRGLFHEVGGFDETLRFAEDWDLVVRLSARSPVTCAKDWLVDSARLPDGLSGDHAAQLDALERMAHLHAPFLRPYPGLHERRLADAGFALLVSGRATAGRRLLRQAWSVRPVSLHAPLVAAAGRLAAGVLRRRMGRHRAGRAGLP